MNFVIENMAELVEGNSEEVYYWSEQDISDTDTYYSEEEEIFCGFKRDTKSSSDSDRDSSDGELKSKFPVEGLGCHDMEKALGRQTFDRKDTLKIFPEEQKQHLQKHHPEILQDLEELHNDGATVAYVSPSVAADLQPTSCTRLTHDVVGDVCVFNPQKPVMMLTFTSGERSSKVIKHNSKSARAFRGVDTATKTLKRDNSGTVSFKASHKDETLGEMRGCDEETIKIESDEKNCSRLEDPDSDLECDGVFDDNKENFNSHVNTKNDEQNNISPSPGCFNHKIKDKPPRQVYTSSKDKPWLKSSQIIYAQQNQNLGDTVCEDSFNFQSSQNTHKSDTVDESPENTPVWPIQGSPKDSDEIQSHKDTRDTNARCDLASRLSVNNEISQYLNHQTGQTLSQSPEVDHDVLRDISVISTALTMEEWKNPEVFRRKVQDLEALAREVELPESLNMDPERYVRVVRSFFDRVHVAAAQKSAQRLKTLHTK